MENVTVIYSQDKLKFIFKNYTIQEDGVVIEMTPEEADDMIAYIELSEDIDNAFL
jgi:hypothetical protein